MGGMYVCVSVCVCGGGYGYVVCVCTHTCWELWLGLTERPGFNLWHQKVRQIRTSGKHSILVSDIRNSYVLEYLAHSPEGIYCKAKTAGSGPGVKGK